MSVTNDVAAKRREIEQAEAELRRVLATLGELGVTCVYDRDMKLAPHVKPGYDAEKACAAFERAAGLARRIAQLRAELGEAEKS